MRNLLCPKFTPVYLCLLIGLLDINIIAAAPVDTQLSRRGDGDYPPSRSASRSSRHRVTISTDTHRISIDQPRRASTIHVSVGGAPPRDRDRYYPPPANSGRYPPISGIRYVAGSSSNNARPPPPNPPSSRRPSMDMGSGSRRPSFSMPSGSGRPIIDDPLHPFAPRPRPPPSAPPMGDAHFDIPFRPARPPSRQEARPPPRQEPPRRRPSNAQDFRPPQRASTYSEPSTQWRPPSSRRPPPPVPDAPPAVPDFVAHNDIRRPSSRRVPPAVPDPPPAVPDFPMYGEWESPPSSPESGRRY